MSDKRKFLIDCDTGVDDAQAIMMVLAQADIDVLAVTVVNGNCSVDQACVNTLRVLKVCKRLDIPVYRGSSKPLILREEFNASCVHGGDGLGDAPESNPPTLDLIQKEHAVDAVIRLVNKYRGEITLVTLGPLTNIALALRLDPELGLKLKNVVTMGGNIEAYGGVVGTSLSGEFNFSVDPEAAYIFLNDLKHKIKLISFETCCLHHSISWDWYDKWATTDSDIGRFNLAIMKNKAKRTRTLRPHFVTCDPVAMAVAINHQVAIETVEYVCTVELHGQFTHSQMVIDWHGKLKKEPNVEIVKKYDVELTKHLLEKAVQI